ncbi:hypothetical protein BU14_0106s0005 [Porphyra umbilicalis]|uniref:Uncharacterized protein n=1 Tax=Porphyra umbilicalis TaxID=2786 RepID=A0A1X6PC89_PORUM|nr:hypothetical protein BU14_0106s0005 [Porphyra umbilicalis]|eukprot:OSX78539.1 hypothetical protein BU14_0106s0005 [Porphyra umbilicalis]
MAFVAAAPLPLRRTLPAADRARPAPAATPTPPPPPPLPPPRGRRRGHPHPPRRPHPHPPVPGRPSDGVGPAPLVGRSRAPDDRHGRGRWPRPHLHDGRRQGADARGRGGPRVVGPVRRVGVGRAGRRGGEAD